MSVPNQKIIKLAPRTRRDKDHLYAMMNLDAMQEAMKVLNGSSIKLWMYFNKNAEGYKFELSRVDCEKWGIKKDAYYHAVKELMAKGFLVPIHEDSNIFLFHERAVSVIPQPFTEGQNQVTVEQKEVSEIQERNITNNTEIIQNNTLESTEDDDIAEGDIVDCGEATIPKNETFDEWMKRAFGTYKHEVVYESPTAVLDNYF